MSKSRKGKVIPKALKDMWRKKFNAEIKDYPTYKKFRDMLEGQFDNEITRQIIDVLNEGRENWAFDYEILKGVDRAIDKLKKEGKL